MLLFLGNLDIDKSFIRPIWQLPVVQVHYWQLIDE